MPTTHSTRTSAARPMLGATALLAALLALGGCGRQGDQAGGAAKTEAKAEAGQEEKSLKLTPEEQKLAGIALETLSLRAIEDAVSVTATVHANQDRIARIAPRVEGRLVLVNANLGDTVRPGQALAVMDSLAIGEAQSTLLRAQSADRVAQADFKRAESLSAEEIISQRDLLRARGEMEKARAELVAAQDRLRLLGGSAGSAGRAESTFALTAPFAGTVIQKKAIIGDLATPAEAVFTVADLSKVWIEANLTEDILAKIKSGAAATVTVGAYPGERFAGRVTYISNVLDRESRTAAARVEVANVDGRLKPEMFATATIETGGAKREALSVPDAAIVLLQGQPTVFVEERGDFEPRPIEPGEKRGGRTVVKSGVAPDDKVVIAGAYALKARLLKSQIGSTD